MGLSRLTPKLTYDMNENKQNAKTEDSSVNSVGFSELLAEKNTRWFIKKGATTSYIKGFTSKSNAYRWIRENPNLNWAGGSFFQIYGESSTWQIVDRKGNILS